MSKTISKPPADEQLDDEALKNLAGFFDVLIQIDLEQKAKQQADTKPPTERPNGLTGKDNNLVPISIITGTRL
jgi:hypothetical protein